MELDDLINRFESKTKNKKERYKEFCAYCWYVFDKEIKSTKSEKMINRYNTMRQKMISYIFANEKKITIQLTKVTGHPWPLPESGKLDVVIDGNMTISGITNPTQWNGILTIEESSLTGLISTEITWGQFSLSKPKLPFIISVDDEIVLELDVLAAIQK